MKIKDAIIEKFVREETMKIQEYIEGLLEDHVKTFPDNIGEVKRLYDESLYGEIKTGIPFYNKDIEELINQLRLLNVPIDYKFLREILYIE